MSGKVQQAESDINRQDLSRPQYHFLPARNWMNDPNGVIQWKGRYHLFYQYNPFGAYHDHMHWGHAVSDDLVHWQELALAIAPDANTVDEGGIFSGCMVNNDGIPTAFYTGVNPGATIQQQCIATSDDTLMVWQKHPQNPVVAAPPASAGQTGDFRDPFVWRDGDSWYMAVGSRIEGVGGAVFLYTSHNLTDWEYLHPLLVGDLARHGVMWECPNFFPLGDKWVLVISSHIGYSVGNVLYFVGEYRNQRFYPEYEAVLDAGFYYAPLTMLDDQQRRIMWGWIRETRSHEDQMTAGWSGVQAIPRVLTLDAQNRLQMNPVPELKSLRSRRLQLPAAGEAMPLPGLALDIEASFQINTDEPCGITIQWASADEKVVIHYDPILQTINLQSDTKRSEESPPVIGRLHRLEGDETLDLRILVDGSVIEIIANGRTSFTQRVYPQKIEAPALRIQNPQSMQSLDVWKMQSIW